MRNKRRRLLPACAGVVLLLAAGGCQAKIDNPLAALDSAATDVLDQVASSDLASPPSVAEIRSLAEQLGLDEQQNAQALSIYSIVNENFGDLRRVAVAEMRAALSAAQYGLLLQVANNPLDQAGVSQTQRQAVQPVLDLLVARLGLTTDQQTQMQAVRANLRLATEILRAQAREVFVGLLTDGQSSLLSQLGGI